MLSWIKRLFSSDPPDVYSVRERMIYTYWDGQKWVKADPMVLHKNVMKVGPELDVAMKVAASPLKEAPFEHDRYMKFVRDAFNVKSFADGGLTDLEVADLLDHFFAFCSGVKKNSSPTPTSAATTSPSTASTPAAASPTPSTSGSGSTANASSTGGPSPSPTAPPSPSA